MAGVNKGAIVLENMWCEVKNAKPEERRGKSASLKASSLKWASSTFPWKEDESQFHFVFRQRQTSPLLSVIKRKL